MNILVTGGTGFIGSHLLSKLVSMHHKIFVIKRKSSNLWRIKSIKQKINLLKIDTFADLPGIFEQNKFDIIIHLAMKYVKRNEDWKDVKEINETNITLPAILLTLAQQHKIKAFINTGTCFEYNLSNSSLSENDPINPYNYYSSTKVAFENILKYFVDKKSIKGLTLKLFFPYGEMDNQKVIPLMINSVLSNTPLELTLGEQKLGFTYVDDIIDAYIKSIEFIEKNKLMDYEVFNIGTDKTTSLKQLSGYLENISGKKGLISFTEPYPSDEIMHMSCNSKRANRILNWHPKTDIIEGLTKTYQYYTRK